MKKSSTMLGRLLEEISWEGNARKYRDGGRGRENVLSAETFQALDALPRSIFLGCIIEELQGRNVEAKARLRQEIEDAKIELLPGDVPLVDPSESSKRPFCVQPDAIITTTSVYALLEVKRIRRGAFQTEQLARELVAVWRSASARFPLLILVLPTEPPIPVKAHGQLALRDAILLNLEAVLERIGASLNQPFDPESLVDQIVAWVTWPTIQAITAKQAAAFSSGSSSVEKCIRRLAFLVDEAIRWHS